MRVPCRLQDQCQDRDQSRQARPPSGGGVEGGTL
ncbi:MAG: hypothetical protein ACI841_004046, partial [Planctomycetota bacterium]